MTKNIMNLAQPIEVDQSVPLDTRQVKNNAGGYVYDAGIWARLDRFLILGVDGPTAYLGQADQAYENIQVCKDALAEDGQRFVRRVAEISHQGRGITNEPAIYALALAAKTSKSPEVRNRAFATLPAVCRIPTHLFRFAEYVGKLGGWGRATRTAFSKYYLSYEAEKLAYHLCKYRQRDGWTHRDVLRLAHPKTHDAEKNALLAWAVGKPDWCKNVDDTAALSYLKAFEALQSTNNVDTAVMLIERFGFTHEMLPTELKVHHKIWEVLLPKMPLTALVRNLGQLSKMNLLTLNSPYLGGVVERLTDQAAIKAARLNPFNLLIAKEVYGRGSAVKGQNTWPVNAAVTDALEAGLYKSFTTIEPSGKRFLVAVDVSGSMGSYSVGKDGILTARDAALLLAMVLKRTEEDVDVVAFAAKEAGDKYRANMHHSGVIPLDVTKGTKLSSLVQTTKNMPFLATDCSLPMLHALEQEKKVDVFVVITDNETWSGKTHPMKALQTYREQTGIAAKLVVIAMTPTKFTIADPQDMGTLDIVGFDPVMPALLTGFAAGLG